VFTTESGEWKLSGFEVLSSMKDDDANIYVSSRPFHEPLITLT
jgi:SCY1-like protein 1